MLTCPKCGFDNQLGRIFCHQCGSKLDLSQIRAPSQGGKRLRNRLPRVKDMVRWVLELAALVAVIYVFYLMALIPPARIIVSTNEDLLSLNRKRAALEQLTNTKQPASMSVTEAELNSYLDKLGFEKAEGKVIAVEVRHVQMELGEGVVTVVVDGTAKLFGKLDKDVALRYTVVPVIEKGAFFAKPVAADIGQLPFPRVLLDNTAIIQGYYEQLFRGLKDDQQLLERLSSISVNPQRVQLNYQPKPPE